MTKAKKNAEVELEKAEQQIYGWNCCRIGEGIVSLIIGMGLTKAEWNRILSEGRIEYLPEYVKDRVTDYFYDKEK